MKCIIDRKTLNLEWFKKYLGPDNPVRTLHTLSRSHHYSVYSTSITLRLHVKEPLKLTYSSQNWTPTKQINTVNHPSCLRLVGDVKFQRLLTPRTDPEWVFRLYHHLFDGLLCRPLYFPEYPWCSVLVVTGTIRNLKNIWFSFSILRWPLSCFKHLMFSWMSLFDFPSPNCHPPFVLPSSSYTLPVPSVKTFGLGTYCL